MAARSKAWVCGSSPWGTAGLNPQGAGISISCECFAFSSTGLCDWLINRPEESYRMCVSVSLSVIKCKNNPLHLELVGRRRQNKKERK